MDYDAVFRTDASKEFRLPKPVSEDNWKSRMNFCNNFSEAITAHGKNHLPNNFLEQLDQYFNNILDCAISERTQLSNSACKLIALLPKILGRDMHPHLDRCLPILLKLCASTKAVTVKVAAAAVSSIIEFSTYSPRLLWHVCQVFEDKSAGPKIHATTWLQTIMRDYHKSIHSERDFEMITRSLLLALEDADATVRTNSRATYWTYSKLDSDGAHEIMEKLNRQAKTALINDQHNPDKKMSEKSKDPPRSQSALALVREEQKKKRALEKAQLQRRAFETSTGSQDQIEIHEPRNSKLDRSKKNESSHPMSSAMEEDDKKLSNKPNQKSHAQQSNATNHRKTPSQDNDTAKPTASSRLLSAPVRRPRIVATPMNPTQTSRPSSRAGQVPQVRDQKKDHQREQSQDSRPASSSSSKALGSVSRAEKISKAPTSPKIKAVSSPDARTGSSSSIPQFQTKPSSPHSRHYVPSNPTIPTTSPDGRAVADRSPRQIRSTRFVPEGKENNDYEVGSFSKSTDTSFNTRPTYIQTPPKKRQSPNDHNPVFGPRLAKQTTSPIKRELAPGLSKPGREMREVENNDLAIRPKSEQPLHAVNIAGHVHPETGRLPGISPKKQTTTFDVGRAREYFASLCRNLATETLPPLGFRRLKGLLEEYNTELIQDQEVYDGLMQLILYQIVSHEDIDGKKENPADYMINPVYNRQVLLQMIAPLLHHFPQWAQNWLWSILFTLILYRNTLPGDGTDRRIIYCDQNINRVIQTAQNPLGLIDSAMQALVMGEDTYINASERVVVQSQGGAINRTTATFELPDEQHHSAGQHPTENGDLYSIRSRWMHLSESQTTMHGANMEETITIYLQRVMSEMTDASPGETILQKKLPFLLECGTSALTLILVRATADNYSLSDDRTDVLCRWAAHCMANYSHVIRRAIISYCQALYGIMKDDQLFFSYFEDEGQINLLNYYLVGLRPSDG